MMSERVQQGLIVPFVGLGLLITIVIGLGIAASQPVIALLATYSSLAFIGYAKFVGRAVTGFDVVFWALPGAIAASVMTVPDQQPWLVGASDPAVTAVGVGALYGGAVGACVAVARSTLPLLSMRVATWALVLFVGVLGLGALALPACGCSTRSKAYLAAMKSDLRNLATVQEAHHADHGTYAGAVTDLDGYVASSGVHVRVMVGTDDSWVAMAVHDRSDAVCRISVGRKAPQREPDGRPHCLEGG